eukprot:COSAG06_NODE_11575_length_1489_cov_19.236691_2_plen_289_part_00
MLFRGTPFWLESSRFDVQMGAQNGATTQFKSQRRDISLPGSRYRCCPEDIPQHPYPTSAHHQQQQCVLVFLSAAFPAFVCPEPVLVKQPLSDHIRTYMITACVCGGGGGVRRKKKREKSTLLCCFVHASYRVPAHKLAERSPAKHGGVHRRHLRRRQQKRTLPFQCFPSRGLSRACLGKHSGGVFERNAEKMSSSFYQDRLGTSIGKTQTQAGVSAPQPPGGIGPLLSAQRLPPAECAAAPPKCPCGRRTKTAILLSSLRYSRRSDFAQTGSGQRHKQNVNRYNSSAF